MTFLRRRIDRGGPHRCRRFVLPADRGYEHDDMNNGQLRITTSREDRARSVVDAKADGTLVAVVATRTIDMR